MPAQRLFPRKRGELPGGPESLVSCQEVPLGQLHTLSDTSLAVIVGLEESLRVQG